MTIEVKLNTLARTLLAMNAGDEVTLEQLEVVLREAAALALEDAAGVKNNPWSPDGQRWLMKRAAAIRARGEASP